MVGLAWYFSGSTDTSASLAALGQAPGIAPPDYAYLDNARVALYLGQLEGGIANSEQLTQQLTRNGNAGLSAGGLSLGGSVGSTATAERVVTPTATARFYQLLDLLGRDRYLHTINMRERPGQIARAFAAVPEGSFVELQNCSVKLPAYVQLMRGARSGFDVYDQFGLDLGFASPTIALVQAQLDAGQIVDNGSYKTPKGLTIAVLRRIHRAIQLLLDRVGRNPRVPLSTCDDNIPKPDPALGPDLLVDPLNGVDLLMPIQLANLSPEPTLLSGPVTMVGKLVRAVRNNKASYVDDQSLTTFASALAQIDDATSGLGSSRTTYHQELDDDAAVLAPGAVILPVAIYK